MARSNKIATCHIKKSLKSPLDATILDDAILLSCDKALALPQYLSLAFSKNTSGRDMGMFFCPLIWALLRLAGRHALPDLPNRT